MERDRSHMTVRLVPLSSDEASDVRVPGSAAERVALAVRLSEMLWTHTGRALPSYSRATMPIVITSLNSPERTDDSDG